MMRTSTYFQFFRVASLAALILFAQSFATPLAFADYIVAKSGSNKNDGTAESPFLTINHAAQLAMPGDTITVREGVYREWIKPVRGGDAENRRITYRAKSGEDVRILGSESAKGWKRTESGLWKLVLPDSFFKNFNPFNTLTRHPVPVKEDESGDGWGWLKYGRWTHLGDVFLDGEGLTEKRFLKELDSAPLTWHTQTAGGKTTIWANFGEADPNVSSVEINCRPFAFFPEKPGVNYITVKGFIFMNVANHWAPPVNYQPAAIGPNGGHHWIIEDNIIMYAKAAGISIGVPTEEADFLRSGFHIIRNNVILRCGQSGITGQSWNSHSQIYGNHIEDINYRKEFGGWETAAIKHHGGDSLLISNNFIRRVYTAQPDSGAAHGIWNDFQNTNWRVTGNIVLGAEGNAILVEANWTGPSLYDNNIFIGGAIATYSSCGDAWVHNMFIQTPQQWENQQWGNRPKISNTRWINNVFFQEGFDAELIVENDLYDHNVYFDNASPHIKETNTVSLAAPSNVAIKENDQGVLLQFIVDDAFLKKNFPIVDNEMLNLDFSFEPTVNVDFYGRVRNQKNNKAGSFIDLLPGLNEFVIFEYSPLYKKALSMFGRTP